MNKETKIRYSEFLLSLNKLCKDYNVYIDNAEFFDKGNFSGYIETLINGYSIVLDDIVTVSVEIKDEQE